MKSWNWGKSRSRFEILLNHWWKHFPLGKMDRIGLGRDWTRKQTLKRNFVLKENVFVFPASVSDVIETQVQSVQNTDGFIWRDLYTYRISSNSFRETYSFLNFEIVANSNSCRNISILYLLNWIFIAETIQGRKLFKSGNYKRKHGKLFH